MYPKSDAGNQDSYKKFSEKIPTTGSWDPDGIFDPDDYPTLTLVQREPTNQGAAMRLAEAGLSVFPCDEAKKPLGGIRWREESSCDEAQIVRWWDRWPNALPAIDCGKSGLLVIDCDRHGGPDGVAAFEMLIDEQGLPGGYQVVHTPSDGLHFYFRQPSDGAPVGNSRGALPPGIDVRGSGGYVIASGATLPDGRQWSGIDGMDDIDDAFEMDNIPEPPAWLVDMIRAPKMRDDAPARAPHQQPSLASGERPSDDAGARAWARAALEGKAAELVATGKGGRNHAINASAYGMGTMVARGWIDRATVHAALLEASYTNGYVKDKGRKSFEDSFRSGFSSGLQNPHDDLPEREEDREIEALTAWIGRMISKEYELPAEEDHEEGEDIETGEVVSDEAETSRAPSGVANHELPEHLTRPAGVLGDMVDWITDSAQRPNRVLALGSAISVLATITGRRVAGPTFSGTHQYVIMLARSAAGKDHPLRRSTDLARAATGGEHLIGPGDFMSQTALIKHVGEKPLSLCASDEIGAILVRICHPRAGNWERGITKALREYWGASFETVSGMQWADTKTPPIKWPALSLLGVTVHDEFFGALSSKDATNGFLNRFLMLSTNAKVTRVSKPRASKSEIPYEIERRLAELYRDSRGDEACGLIKPEENILRRCNDNEQIVIDWADDEVLADYDKLVDCAIAKADVAAIGEIYGRTAEIAIRLATIHAVSRAGLDANVTHEDFAWGSEVAMWSADTMAREASLRMADTEPQRRAQRVLRIITESGGRIKHRDLNRKLQHSYTPKERDDAIKALVDSDTIERKSSTPAKGGTATVWYVLAKAGLP